MITVIIIIQLVVDVERGHQHLHAGAERPLEKRLFNASFVDWLARKL